MKGLREYREAKEWSQQELAHQAGLSIRSISAYETNGIGTAKFDTVKKLCKLLDADIQKIK